MPDMNQEQSTEVVVAKEPGSVLDEIPKCTYEIKAGLIMFASCM